MKHSAVKHTLTSVFVATLVLGLHGTAVAAPLAFAPTAAGLTFTIENLGPVADLFAADGNPNDTYAIVLTLTTTPDYVDAGDADLLAAFAIDVSSSALDAATLSGPAGYSWTLKGNDTVPGNSAKCNGSEPGGLCVEELASPNDNLVLDALDTYSWLFQLDLGVNGFADATRLDIAIATLMKSGDKFHGASTFTAYADGLGGVATRQIPPGGADPAVAPVPEPGSLLLLGTGLTLAASRLKRRR